MMLTVHHHFDAAHRLSKHPGKCNNLHGHRWEVEVTVEADELNKNDMVVDIGDIKKIIDEYDHSLLVNKEVDRGLHDFVEKAGWKMTSFLGDPTSERICKVLKDKLENKLKVKVREISVWESPDAYVELIE